MVFRAKPPQRDTCHAILIGKTHGIKIGGCIAKLHLVVYATSVFIVVFAIICIVVKINGCVHFISRCEGFLIGDGYAFFAICPIVAITRNTQNNLFFRNIFSV